MLQGRRGALVYRTEGALLSTQVMTVSVITMVSIRYGAQFIYVSESIWSPADPNLSNGRSFVEFP